MLLTLRLEQRAPGCLRLSLSGLGGQPRHTLANASPTHLHWRLLTGAAGAAAAAAAGARQWQVAAPYSAQAVVRCGGALGAAWLRPPEVEVTAAAVDPAAAAAGGAPPPGMCAS